MSNKSLKTNAIDISNYQAVEKLTPKEIVEILNRYIVGQHDAKKTVAIAFRNRWRRKQLSDELKNEIIPKNILMIGPTGVGKTEIARRLARFTGAPFIKVEATKFTELGYVGKDVDSIIRDLVEIAVNMVRFSLKKEVHDKAKLNAKQRILDSLVGDNASIETREKFEQMLDNGQLDDKEIELKLQDNQGHSMPTFGIPGMPGSQMGFINIGDIIGKTLGVSNKTKLKKLKIVDAYKYLISEESDKMLDEEKIVSQAVNLVENDGIVFLDEIDKIIARGDYKNAEVSREGVQRDLLPLIEGTSVSTKYGSIKTDHILFIASGAFHIAKPSDLLPELRGRLPIKVELKPLSQEDMLKILKEPDFNILMQYQALLKTENIILEFTSEAVLEIARLATEINKEVENIGARRLHTIMEKLLEDISYNAANKKKVNISIDDKYVLEKLGALAKQTDLSKFIL